MFQFDSFIIMVLIEVGKHGPLPYASNENFCGIPLHLSVLLVYAYLLLIFWGKGRPSISTTLDSHEEFHLLDRELPGRQKLEYFLIFENLQKSNHSNGTQMQKQTSSQYWLLS